MISKPAKQCNPKTWSKTAFILKSFLVIVSCAFLLQCRTNRLTVKSEPTHPVDKYSSPAHFESLYAGAEMKYSRTMAYLDRAYCSTTIYSASS